eukprot:GHRR01033756.1.p1 GENE.GHRR01033756.1~~GHRR01033756.1.p1  ORF type:complete len:110 (-),score=18.48 GHRR01033756.1:653-982(-)
MDASSCCMTSIVELCIVLACWHPTWSPARCTYQLLQCGTGRRGRWQRVRSRACVHSRGTFQLAVLSPHSSHYATAGLDGLQSLKLAHKKLQAVEVSDHMLLVGDSWQCM